MPRKLQVTIRQQLLPFLGDNGENKKNNDRKAWEPAENIRAKKIAASEGVARARVNYLENENRAELDGGGKEIRGGVRETGERERHHPLIHAIHKMEALNRSHGRRHRKTESGRSVIGEGRVRGPHEQRGSSGLGGGAGGKGLKSGAPR